MKKFTIFLIGLLYLSFLFIHSEEVEDTGFINAKSGFAVIVGAVFSIGKNGITEEEKTKTGLKVLNKYNEIISNENIVNYKEKLNKEANFEKGKFLDSGKNGFKRDYLFLLYLKDALIFIAKLTILIFLLIILKRLVLNQKVI